MAPFVPNGRELHTATFVDNKLYILGGLAFNTGKDFFYIDFSVPFNTQNIVFNDLSSINTVPSHFSAGSAKGGANNDTLFVCGGSKNDNSAQNAPIIPVVHTFNPQNNSWSTPTTGGIMNPILKDATTGVIDYNGIMYFWNGIASKVITLDTKKLIWTNRNSTTAPNIGLESAVTLLPDNKIIYMESSISNLVQVYIYDIINDNWNMMTTSGKVPTQRPGASAVLGLDGQRVIVYGGTADPLDSLYELNLINFEWRVPKTSGKMPSSRISHKANVIGKYMVVSFGTPGNIKSDESNILLLDISNNDEYVWTNEYNPSSNIIPSPTLPSPSSTIIYSSIPSSSTNPSQPTNLLQAPKSNSSVIIGAVIGSLLGSILSFAGGFFLYKQYKNRNDNVDYGHEIVLPRDEYMTNNEPVNTSINNNYYDGTANNEPVSSSSTANDGNLSLQELKQEIQDLRQVILQNNNKKSMNFFRRLFK
ncbi:hypothetical protein RclHR1_03040013 [Rhizophagus clarus]|nr:hypothetical protein RclHR1_03040013 [Rhizophagus clarus]